MSAPPTKPGDPNHPPHAVMSEVGVLRALLQVVRSRILSGLIAALPIALTFFIVHWLYVTLTTLVLSPAIALVQFFLGNHGLSERFWSVYVAPVLAVVLVLTLLYLLGVFVQLRVMKVVDWAIMRVPLINTIFKAVNNVFQSLGQQLQGNQGFKRVVLVEFPHPGMRSLAFVTNSLYDTATGRTILCVCVLTGVMPPAGFTLFVPEESVTDIDWSMNQTLQAILSGGITAPATIRYFAQAPVSPFHPISGAPGPSPDPSGTDADRAGSS
jgi:uncharacterized membrane protein